MTAAYSLRSAATLPVPAHRQLRSRRRDFTKDLFEQTAYCRKHSSVDQSDFCVFIEYQRRLRQSVSDSTRASLRASWQARTGMRWGAPDERVVGKEHGLSGGSLCHGVNRRSIGRQAQQRPSCVHHWSIRIFDPFTGLPVRVFVRLNGLTSSVAALPVQVVLSPFWLRYQFNITDTYARKTSWWRIHKTTAYSLRRFLAATHDK